MAAAKFVLVGLTALALAAMAAPPAQAVSVGFCVVGVCDGVSEADPAALPPLCQSVESPPVSGVLGPAAVLVILCTTP